MATCTHRAAINTTTNANTYASGSFTPTAGDLLVVGFSPGALTGTSAQAVTASANGITFTEVTAAADVRASVDDVRLFVADQLVPASPSSMTITADAGGAASGMNGWVVSVAGLTRTGLSAVRGAAGGHGASGVTPTATLPQAALTGNPVLAFGWNATNTSGLTLPTSPAFTSGSADIGYATPTRGGRYGFINSGLTSATVTWGGTSGTASANIAVELDTSAAGVSGAAALSVTSTQTAAATVGAVADAALSVTSTRTAAGLVGAVAAASLAVTVTLTASGVVGGSGVSGDANLTGTATLSAAGTVGTATGAALSGTATSTATGVVGRVGSASLAASATNTATGVVGASSTASLAATATLSAAGTVTSEFIGTASLAATVTLTATGEVVDVANLRDITAAATLLRTRGANVVPRTRAAELTRRWKAGQ